MYTGKHYETGTISNAMTALGSPVTEDLALGASGGIAFGCFVFEYKGDLPHVALLTRNTFAPFERALDNLGIRREVRETTDGVRAERNLRNALDDGHKPLVWADVFSLPYLRLETTCMWMMRPLLVVGQEGDDFLVADGAPEPIRISTADLAQARGKVKKDRHRLMILEKPDEDRMAEGLMSGIETAAALMLDKPPAGSADNFGVQGMKALAKALTDIKGPKPWATKFEPGARLIQALAGRPGQPGVWDWIETWGTASGGDRGTYASFLREAAPKTGLEVGEIPEEFDKSAGLWRQLAGQSMPDGIPEFAELKQLKLRYAQNRDQRPVLRDEIRGLTTAAAQSESLAARAPEIRAAMAETIRKISEIELPAFEELRAAVRRP